MRNFLDLADFQRDQIVDLLAFADRLRERPEPAALAGKVLGLLFFNPSLRTLASTFVRAGWLGDRLLTEGLFGIAALRPEALFGMSAFNPLSHAVFWSIFCNGACYVLGSLLFRQDPKEQMIAAEDFVDILKTTPAALSSVPGEAFVLIDEKIQATKSLLCQYYPEHKAAFLVRQCLQDMNLAGKKRISIVELIELHGEVERQLAGSIGAAAAYHALRDGLSFRCERQIDSCHPLGRARSRRPTAVQLLGNQGTT